MGSTAANRSDSTFSGKLNIYNSYVQLLDLQNNGELESCVKSSLEFKKKKHLSKQFEDALAFQKRPLFFVHCNCYKTSRYKASVRPSVLGNIGKVSLVSVMLALWRPNIHCDLCIQRVLVSS